MASRLRGPPQYGIPQSEVQVLKDQAVQRAKRRHEFLRQATDPVRHGEGGYVFDPAVQRYLSMNARLYDYFKPTRRTTLYGIIALVPFVLFYSLLRWDRTTKEAKFRRGEVAYRDRSFKFI